MSFYALEPLAQFIYFGLDASCFIELAARTGGRQRSVDYSR
ncbi:MAG TPA: hypothetical protein VFH56_09785 [Acidimicrobiales bacterium]|nr:hypothetical protein [Acidimicrobiales bacterium]